MMGVVVGIRYTLRQLDYFIAAGEAGSIRHASELLSISQPSISTAISHLEQELGVQLFVRHHAQGLSLTHAGRELLVEARRIVQMAEALYTTASEATEQVRGQLSIGSMVTLAPMIMPALAHGFMSHYPMTEIRQLEADQEWLLDRLRRAQIDLAITYDLQVMDDMEFSPLASLPPHVLVSEDHPFATRAEISLAELAPEPLILLDLPLSREYFFALFLKEGLEPKIYTRSAHQEVVRTMVANGYGYTLANVRPRSDRALDGRRVVTVPLAGDHRPMVIGTMTLARVRKPRLLEAFEEHCRIHISNRSIPGMFAPDASSDS
ncbi:LysR family transcriptional regulator [Tanticharoenia sakaeratensis]|jgi:DNA-binding transcriptional LysR family regulator|uniref:LysR family transcriptional regulator n=1 Tax=Tanticharoenia sakaeratensis NBRC 103193 TaxID=1231623 RepID=A0A0D6MQH2_9PROT|nr:LysR family transcriptional regulator [Tanticharoenia sakaeratensis]GAN55650.1 LysR family transcriptional regulator [Tanticharoenia sakaeratensis NBRC 103193]GBQ16513.1 LysR family transcriptional regulator [Tanticharoenia sakaeratensis NBRC 103193]